ncbi:molybdate ABC transporter substrate-binding protein [Sneathiella marina]|uniref:Molybdate ABC transporter substrate-binding protein n=1 Tax=Sneathiella marina TaxID=2950108 RepID=A0ABY4W6A3_9PROT|nr:molybdate ABC transporter substrate-binding protein [Sneathiella marina]USG62386.1 molybdate ABC transporter substrate-binding protein [Sneathiella marina]
MPIGRLRFRNIFYKLLITAVIAVLCVRPAMSAERDIVVFAAASTTDVVSAIVVEFERRTGFQVTTSFASSGTLAKQVREGAPANIFISANKTWLDYLVNEKLLLEDGYKEIASNQLVLVAPKEERVVDPFIIDNLPEMLEGGFLAIGNPDHVPVGIYAKAALHSLKLWDALKGKYVALPNARAVTALVEREEVPFAVIYETDAKTSKNLKVVTTFPPDSYPAIIYGLGLIKDYDSHAAKEFVKFVLSPDGRDIFDQYGFVTLKN